MPQTAHRSTTRVLDIFDLLSTQKPEGANLTEIAQALDSPKSSILPILQTLAARGYIELDYRTSRYSIGVNLFVAASIYRNKISTNKFIDMEMRHLSSQLGEPVCLGILRERKTLFLHRTDPSDSTVYCDKSPGQTELACLGAIGKALLCDYKLNELSDLFLGENQKLPDNINLYRIHVQMEETRFTGFSYEYGEVEPGIQCVASPIRVKNQVMAAVGIILPTFRLTPEKIIDCTRLLPISVQKIENVLANSTEELKEVFSLEGFKNL